MISAKAELKRQIRRYIADRPKNSLFPAVPFVEQFVLCMGVECIPQPLPAGIKPGRAKMCVQNAFRLVLMHQQDLTYCEGFAFSSELSFLFHHAWAIDGRHRVIDPTLHAPEYSYFGVPFSHDDLLTFHAAGGGMLYDVKGAPRRAFLLERCPSLAERC